jgi:hypothetical protein
MVMRNPGRIDKYCDELNRIWHKVPDWRLGQLMVNFISQIKVPLPFYLEDEDFINMLRQYVERNINES